MDAPDPAAPPSSPALDYAPRQGGATARRRWGRRLLRWWPAWVLLMLGGLGVAYGPGAWRHYRLMRLQEACMAAELPADRPVVEEDPVAAAALVTTRPAEYRLGADGGAERVDPRWEALAAKLNLPPGAYMLSDFVYATTFCHERFTPNGRRRLVVVEGWSSVTVMEPAGWLDGREPRVLGRTSVHTDDVALSAAVNATARLAGARQTGAGVPDAADRSRWTVPIVLGGVRGTLEYRLGDDDAVTMRLVDPDGFAERAVAAHFDQQVDAALAEAAKSKAAAARPATEGSADGDQ